MSVLVYIFCWKNVGNTWTYIQNNTNIYIYIHGHGNISWKYRPTMLVWVVSLHSCPLLHCSSRGPGNPAEVHRIQSHPSHQDLTSSREWSANGEALLKDILVTSGHYGSRFDLHATNHHKLMITSDRWGKLTQSSWSFWASHSLIPLQHQLPFTKNISKKRTPFNFILEPPSCAHTHTPIHTQSVNKRLGKDSWMNAKYSSNQPRSIFWLVLQALVTFLGCQISLQPSRTS